MSLTGTIKEILVSNPEGLSPREIVEIIKARYPDQYGTESHRSNVERGHYKDLDHALTAQIYTASRGGSFEVDRSQTPLRLRVVESFDQQDTEDDVLFAEDIDKIEAGIGTLYVLGTSLYTQDGKEIIKIGITTIDVDTRIGQLYTTGVPYRFRVISQKDTKNFYELEQSIHRLLAPYRINRAREFFTDDCLPHVEKIVKLHDEIQAAASA